MTTPPGAPPPRAPSEPPGTPAEPLEGTESLSGFRALNPADGLFLRAEHLDTIQTYARSLVEATATATGCGVVHGLGVTLAAVEGRRMLRVSPGLAVSPVGRLLRLGRGLSLTLDPTLLPPLQANGFWVVELHFTAGTSGSAPVYGSLCHDACSDSGGTIAPWRDEGVEVRLVPDTMPGLVGTTRETCRNWLASEYFERERRAGAPWLVPSLPLGEVERLPTRPWHDDTAQPADAGVPLAALQLHDGEWVLDQWTARRLVDGPTSQASWRHRLAMRPWSVFLAQVLQLEDQLKDSGATLGGDPAQLKGLVVLDVEVEEALREPLEHYMAEMADKFPSKWHQFTELKEAVMATAARRRGKLTAVRSLEGLRLRELPPAGYLSVDERLEGLGRLLEEFFGPRVDLRLCPLRADQVAGAVQDAQHRDRIPLDSDLGHPLVDVLVPVQPADKPELATDAYGWVAFVRRPPECGHDPVTPDEVGVYVALAGSDAPESRFRGGELGDATSLGTVRYPPGGWEFPGGAVATRAAASARQDELLVVVALAPDTARAPLAALRASLFAASMDSGIAPPPVHAFTSAGGDESIVLVLRQPE